MVFYFLKIPLEYVYSHLNYLVPEIISFYTINKNTGIINEE